MCAYRYHDNCYTVDDLDGAPPTHTHFTDRIFLNFKDFKKNILAKDRVGSHLRKVLDP